uniref:Enhancer of polycomb-like protein n=1 Tax=Ananas comosus var. bracteatus TaxID=296719 RepID=A0A6V7P0L8_ANACO|nr:unnamed protein product [Ananas comosus var. bracteatus]
MSVRKNRRAASHSSVISTLSSTGNAATTIALDDNESQVSLLVRKDCSKNRKVSIVYFRKRFRKKGLALDELPQKGLRICITQVEPNKLTLELRISLKSIYYRTFRTEDAWLSRQNFLSYYGKLVLIWPAVRMEIAFVDKTLGSRKFSFEGCFKGAVSLLCFVMKTFCLQEECCKLLEIEMPSTSIAIKVLDLHDQRMQFFSFRYYYWEMESSKQRLLKNNFKQYCLLFSEPAISNFRDGNIENLSNRKDHASVLEDSVFTDALSVSNDVDCMRSFGKHSQTDQRKNEDEQTVIILEKNGSPGQPEARHNDCMNVVNIETDNLHSRVEEELNGMESQISQSSSKVDQEKNIQSLYSSITRDSENMQHDNRLSSASPRSVPYSKLWSENFIQNGFTSRKPRTRISYISPNLGHDISSKHQIHQRKGQTYKKIRIDKPDMECSANVLVTLGDRGWRESGALVVLNSLNQKDYWILVKLSGITKYVHKANQFLQPGIPNRFTHAMMWKGGKDWMLEFTDRSQWSLFKLMHEECYNRNLRAASVKNIPIPGVRLIDDFDESIVEKPFISTSLKYHQEVGTEVDRALDPCNTLYDMDSDDEEWAKTFDSSCGNDDSIVAENDLDIFERVMDMFEKVAYAKNSDQFTAEELEEFMTEFAPLDIITAIYEYWLQKRQKKGLPLIRQFQPALWEIYEQQLRDWEIAINKMKSSSDMHLEKACILERPSMFAFCLRPRGLEVPNKGSKQRSQKRFMFAGHHSSSPRDHDTLNPFGKKSEELTLGGGMALASVANHELSFSPRWHKSSSCFSSKDSPRTGTLIFTKNTVSVPYKNSSIMPASYDGKAKRSGVRLSSSDGF